jgi:hypothetical protein
VRAVEPVTGYDRPYETIAAGLPDTRRGRFSKLPTIRWRTARTAQLGGSLATCANCDDEIETGSRHRRPLFRMGTDTTSSFEEFAACDTDCLASFVAAW